LRQVLNLTKGAAAEFARNAIIVRDTADSWLIARKLLKISTRPSAESVSQAGSALGKHRMRLRDVGNTCPGQSASDNLLKRRAPPLQPEHRQHGSTPLRHLPTQFHSKVFIAGLPTITVTLPGATANFLLTRFGYQIIQKSRNPIH